MDMTGGAIKSTLVVTYSRNSQALWDFLVERGEIVKLMTQIRVFVLRIDPEEADRILAEVAAHPDVAKVEFDEVFKPKLCYVPSDLGNDTAGNANIYKAARLIEAWGIQQGRNDIIGAVSDSGVDPSRPEIKDCLVPGAIFGDIPGVSSGVYPVAVDMYAVLTQYTGITPANISGFSVTFHDPLFASPDGFSEVVDVYGDPECTVLHPNPFPIIQGDVVYVNREILARVHNPGGHFNISGIALRTMRDVAGHGTAVTGVAVGKHGTGEGVCGVAPNCKIMPLVTFGALTTTSEVADSFLHAAANGVKAMNCSWVWESNPGPMPSALQYALDNGVIVVTASANSSANGTNLDTLGFPANYPGVITVSGTGSFLGYNCKASFANRGDNVHISAPATDFAMLLPTNPNMDFAGYDLDAVNEWTRIGATGTSFASPTVFGTVLSMLSEAADRGITLNRTQVEQILEQSADPRLYSTYGTETYDTSTLNAKGKPVGGMGFGLLDACRALRAVQQGIDVRVRQLKEYAQTNVATACVEVDVRTWGSGIASIEVYRDGVLIQTLTPGGTSYKANVNVTFPSAGNSTVHFVATDSNASTSTSNSITVAVAAAALPIIRFRTFATETDDYLFPYLGWFMSKKDRMPVVVDSSGALELAVDAMFGSITVTSLEVRIDGGLKNTFGSFASGTSLRSYTVSTSGLTAGFHTLSVTAKSSSGDVTKTCDMVYNPRTVPAIYAKPYEYKSGVLTVACFADTASVGNETNYYDTLAVYEISLYLDGKKWAIDGTGMLAFKTFSEFKLRVPTPSSVEVKAEFRISTNTPDDLLYNGASTIVSAFPDAAAGNDPSVDTNPPATYVNKLDGRYKEGTTVELKTYIGDASTAINYRWDSEAWDTYATPLAVRTGTLEWYGVDAGGNTEAVNSVTYELIAPPPGAIAAAAVSLTPLVATPSLAGISVGSIAAPSVSLRPSVSTATLSGVQVGSMSVPAVTLRPSVTVGTLTGVEASVGSIAAAATSMQIQVNPPTLRGVTAGTAIRAPDGTAWDLRDIYGAPLDIRQII